MTPPTTDSPAPRRRGRRLRIAGVVLVVLAVGARAALPGYLRTLLEEQGTASLAGRVTVGDVDVSLVRGALVVKDLALSAEDAGPGSLPLVACRRFWVNIGWWPLTSKVVDVEDVGLSGLEVRVDRLADGELVLPALRATEPAPEPEPEPAPDSTGEPAKPWGVIIRELQLDEAAFQLDDHVTDPPEVRELTLPSLHVAGFRLQPDPDAGAGRGRVRLRLEDGKLEIRTRVRAVEGGFDLAVALEATDVPLDRIHVHVPSLGWSRSTGRLGALITGRLSPEKPLVAEGSIELDDLAIEVPGEKEPALAWKRLAIDLDEVNLATRTVAVDRVALAGGRVLVAPGAPSPLPIVPPAAEAEQDDDEPAEEDAVPWAWSVGTVSVEDTRAVIALEPPPLDVMVRKLDVKKLSSKPGAEATLHADVEIADGTLALDGPVTLDPIGTTLGVRATNLDVGLLVAASGGAPVPVAARLDATLDIAAREDPLVVRGSVELRDTEAKLEDGDDFLVAWKRLAAGIDAVTVPGLLPIGAGAPVGPVSVKLASLDIDAPRVVATMSDGGIVLPTASEEPAPAAGAQTAEAADADATEATPKEAPQTDDPVSIAIGTLTVRDGDVRFTDTTVTPAYRGRLASLRIDAHGLRTPGNEFDRFTMRTRVGGKGPVEIVANRDGETITVTSSAKDVSLGQFNSYAAAYGYRIRKGTLGFDSTTTLRGRNYDSDTRVNLDRLAVTDSEGESLFKQTFGVPLSVAIALLRDLDGRISLGIPLSGGEGGTGVGIGSVVREALTRAILGAMSSPLKLLGAVRPGQDEIPSLEPAPIAFKAGTPVMTKRSSTQAKQLASALAQLPSLRIRIAGRTGAKDVRALGEAAVLRDLDEDRAIVGGLRNLFSGGKRSEVHDALRERAAGKDVELTDEASAQLDAWVAEHPVDDESLHALATERATRLQRLLLDAGAKPDQIVTDPVRVRRTKGRSEVDVDIVEDPLAVDEE